ncbi:hypothetical protein [uncultured Allomuricauda sp.]|uniref:hypothetical protein n=1 Tax=Flagellimonas sp. W118 TaxID=3410791 RepID=UPI00262F5B83|nr:hypothetical protein [uncultured Allomuricauda sp.]
MNLKYNTLGEIISGRNAGWYVKLIDDRASSGGIYIYEFKEPDDNEGFDTWLENENDVDGFISESGWKIKWLNKN